MTMKKVQAMLFALVTVFAFGAIAVSSASAETTTLVEWLVNGVSIPAGTTFATETSGELLFEDNNTLVGKIDLLCSSIFHETIGPDGEDKITEILSLAGVKVSDLTGTTPITACANPTNNCTTPKVYAEKLPWPTLAFRMENGEVLDLVEGLAYESTCQTIFGELIDLCETLDTEWPLVNGINDVETPANSPLISNGNCTLGGNGAGIYETETASLITLNNGSALQIS